MRYPRNVKIFRGGVDAAPFAGLFFVLVLFMMLFYSHAFFPGVPIDFSDAEGPPEMTERTVVVQMDGTIRFLGESLDLAGLREAIKERLRTGDLPKRLLLESAPQADERLVQRVENVLKENGIAIKLPGSRLDLPEDAGFAGAPNPVVVVGINLNGQIFFQHQRIDESTLQARLAEVVERTGPELTLILQADRKVSYDKIIQLSKIARRAGIARVRLGTRPSLT